MPTKKRFGTKFHWISLACAAIFFFKAVRHSKSKDSRRSLPEISSTLTTIQHKTLSRTALGVVTRSLSSIFALMYLAIQPGVSIIYWLIFALVALVGALFLAGTLSEPASRASIGAQLCGGALVAAALLLIQADTSRVQQRQADEQKKLDDKRALISSLSTRKDLSGLTFAGRDLSGGFLVGLPFKGSVFQGADLTGTSFACSNLIGARFANNPSVVNEDVNQYGEVIKDAIVGKTDFTGANLSNAKISYLDLSSSNLNFAILQNAKLSYASLPRIMVNVNADGADLTGVDADNSRWSNISLRGADLRRAKLANTDMGGTDAPSSVYNEDLYGPVDLRGTDLRGANLTGALLGGALLTGAIADSSTRWPAGFDAKKAGVLSSLARNVPENLLIPLPNSGCP